MPQLKNLDKVIAVAGGCIAFASGGGTASLAIGSAGSGAALLTSWWETKAKHGPASSRVLSRVRRKVRTELGRKSILTEADEALLEGADYALSRILIECIPSPSHLAEAFQCGEGFSKAATAMVMGEVVARDDLFAETGERAQPLARRFALIAIETALEAALTDREYFAGLLPFVLESMSHGISSIERRQVEHGESFHRIEDSNARLEAGIEALLAALELTPIGRRVTREIGDIRPFVTLARRIKQEIEDPEQALAELSAMVEIVLQQQSEVKQGTNLGDLVDSALSRIAEKSRCGDFDSAAMEAAGAFADWERREATRRETEQQGGLRLIEANIEQQMLRRDAIAVTDWIERQIVLVNGRAVDADALMNEISEWRCRGEEKGLNFDLMVAVEIARRVLARCIDSDRRSIALIWLANLLQSLGARESGTARLEEAVGVYRLALNEATPEHDPSRWAVAQSNLGVALERLGDREAGTARLEESVEAHRLALAAIAHERPSPTWPVLQNHLGSALSALGERESGTMRLEEAVTVFRAALEECPREREPLNWAMIQNNLAGALLRLAEREMRPQRLEEAVGAYRAVLKEHTRDRLPLDWATTQNNLGAALQRLGELEGGTRSLNGAVAAYCAAMEERTRERVPLDWATTQNNLGAALSVLGKRERNLARWEAAVVAYRAALEERTRDRVPLDWAATSLNMARAEAQISLLSSDSARFEQAVALAMEASITIANSGHESLVVFIDHAFEELTAVSRQLAAT